ncbi:MAG: hypothetical protein PHE67_03070 [Campylobacterales bacterium]|nr:hypothetical protein [Campylobacterales bacterium]
MVRTLYFLCCMLLASNLFAAAPLCTNVFGNAAGTTGGILSLNGSSKMYNTEVNGNILQTDSIKNSSIKACQGGTATCVTSQDASSISLPSPNTSNWSALSVNSGSIVNISTDTYYASATIDGTLNITGNITMTFNPALAPDSGDIVINQYAVVNINGNVVIYADDVNINGKINIISGSLTIISNNKGLTGGVININQTAVVNNNGNPANFILATLGDINVNSPSVYGVLYAGHNITVNGSGVVHGAVTARDITMDGTIYYDPDAIDSLQTSLCSSAKKFALVYSTNVTNATADVSIIGNSVLCKKDSSGQCTAPSASENNDGMDTMYYKLASDKSNSGIFNSSSSDITLPSGSEVLWAGLYWQGAYVNAPDNTFLTNAKNVKIKVPGSSSYASLSSDSSKFAYITTDGSPTYTRYQGMVDITSIVKQAGGGTYQVANVYASTGAYYSGGTYGSWAIVIAYKYPDADPSNPKPKNITIYDGFVQVDADNQVAVKLTGFYTPSSGTIDSKFSFYAGEGDAGITGDNISLTNNSGTAVKLDSSSSPNIMNSSITGIANRVPDYANTIGTDIHTYNIGTTPGGLNILGNEQSSTTVKLYSTQDMYFPGVFAFSTQLYLPNVCYTEEAIYNDSGKAFSGTGVVGDQWNVKVSITNIGNETAEGVVVRRVFEEYNSDKTKLILGYVPKTLSIQNISKTDAVGDDTAESSTTSDGLTQLLWRLGTGATNVSDGRLGTAASDYFGYKLQILSIPEVEINNTYFMDYYNNSIGYSVPNIKLSKCVRTIDTGSGYMRAVDSGGGWTSGIKTKILGNTFSLDVLSSSRTDSYVSTTRTLKNAYLVDQNDNIITTLISTNTKVTGKYTINNITPTVASKLRRIKMVDTNNYVSYSDYFAIRPNKFSLSVSPASPTKIVAGEDFSLKVQALDANNVAVKGYNESIAFNLFTNVASARISASELKNGCFVGSFKMGGNDSFVDGVLNTALSYQETGGITIKASESGTGSEYAYIDMQDTDENLRLISSATQNAVFKPYQFKFSNTHMQNPSSAFTYMGADIDNSAFVIADINATTKPDSKTGVYTTTKNYSSGCYENSVNLKIAKNTTDSSIVLSSFSATGLSNTALGFSGGHYLLASDNSKPVLRLGFDKKSISSSSEPIKLSANSAIADKSNILATDNKPIVAISIQDTVDNTVSGTTSDSTLTPSSVNPSSFADFTWYFLYGRLRMPNAMVDYNASSTVRAYAEVYASDSAKLPTSGTWVLSPGTLSWWVNSLDSGSKIANIYIRNNEILAELKNSDPNYTTPTDVTVTAGIASIAIKSTLNQNQKLKFHLNVDSWLWYSLSGTAYQWGVDTTCAQHPCADVEIFGVGSGWFGSGDKKDTQTMQSIPAGKRKQRVNW